MPNWCSNAMTVVGPKDDIVKFIDHINRSRAHSKETGHWELYDIFADLGYAKENGDIDCEDWTRGYLTDGEGDYNLMKSPTGNDEFCAELHFETAWGPMCDAWYRLLKEHFKALRHYTIAEECGNEVYVNTDKEGIFYEEKLAVDGYCSKTNRYTSDYGVGGIGRSSEKDALDAINYAFRKDFKTLKEAKRFAEQLDDDDSFLNIEEYSDC